MSVYEIKLRYLKITPHVHTIIIYVRTEINYGLKCVDSFGLEKLLTNDLFWIIILQRDISTIQQLLVSALNCCRIKTLYKSDSAFCGIVDCFWARDSICIPGPFPVHYSDGSKRKRGEENNIIIIKRVFLFFKTVSVKVQRTHEPRVRPTSYSRRCAYTYLRYTMRTVYTVYSI